MVLAVIKEILNLSITRYDRIRKYLNDLDNLVKIRNKKDLLVINELNEIINSKIIHIKRAYLLLNFFYFGIYFSFFSIFFSKYFFLSEITDLIGGIIGFFGTTIFFVGIFIVNKIIDLYYQDLNLLSSQIIAIYMLNKVTPENIFKDENDYNLFINFFKKRGF